MLVKVAMGPGLEAGQGTSYKHEGYRHPDVPSQEDLSAALEDSPSPPPDILGAIPLCMTYSALDKARLIGTEVALLDVHQILFHC